MQNGSRLIVVAGISLGLLSILYFLSLVLGIPFFITVPLIFIAVSMLWVWVYRSSSNIPMGKIAHPIWAFLLLAAGIFLIIKGSYPMAVKHGAWDAWAFWNIHARYLADPVYWRKLFINITGYHPDYPLLVPGINGFFIRLAAGRGFVSIPFVFSFAVTLFIPVLIYLENLRKSIIVAAIVLLLFARDAFFLSSGVAQYADVPLAFFFLCALICINHVSESRANVVLAAACLGCCAWTKNEGMILALIFILFNARILFSRANALRFILGIALPVLVLLVFKLFYAPKNDMFSGQGRDTFNQLFSAGRYKLICKYFSIALNEKFYYVKVAFFCYLALCVIEKKSPGSQMAMLLCCIIAYMFVYVLSVEYLEWHLVTSIDRLMLQLMPAMMYVIAQKFAGFRFPLRKQHAH